VAVVVAYAVACLMAVGAVVWLRSIWVPLIAAFIAVMAYAEGRAVRVEGSMRRMRVGQFALWDLGGISPQQPLRFALRGGLRDIAVTDNGRVVGMLWRNRLLQELHAGLANQLVGDVMDRDVVTARGDQSVYDVHQLMNQHSRWAIPIVEDGQYRGIFTGDRLLHVYRQLAPPLSPEPINSITSAVDRLVRLVAR
jgi:CBS domain-containing protein